MKELTSLINRYTDCRLINIGSGPNPWVGWNCLDELEAAGIQKIHFSPCCIFPFEDASKDFVYSSHCIEHLNDDTVSRLLKESHRILTPSGSILIKIPDYDWFLKEYLSNSKDFMENIIRFWPSWSWSSFGIKDSPLNKLSYMFCGYWNEAYGDHFSGRINKGPESYNGPAKLSEIELRELFNNSSIREIVQFLRNECLRDSNLKAFNHQNAWSFNDLCSLLNDHNFEVKEVPKDRVIAKYSKLIPDINAMGHWSMYVEASKVT